MDDDAMPDLSVPLQPMGGGPIGVNNFDPKDLFSPDNLMNLWLLGKAELLDSSEHLVPTPLATSPSGQNVLTYTMRCAIPEGQAVTTASGQTFPGAFGLAKEWTKRGLLPEEKEWMTACILQHLNGLDVEVPIMLTGPNPLLVPQSWAETEKFTVEESTMFGNLWTDVPPGSNGLAVFACTEKGLDQMCGGSSSYWLTQRICGSSPLCGLTLLGSCEAVCVPDQDGFWACNGYTRTIRVTLMPDYVEKLYEQCG